MTMPQVDQTEKRSIGPEIGERVKNAILAVSGSYLLWAVLVAAVLLAAINVEPRRLAGWLIGPTGEVFVSSPGVYTRERLVNDRNDQDFWLREQLRLLDEDKGGFSTITNSDLRLKVDAAATPGGSGEPVGDAPTKNAGGEPQAAAQPSLSFLDSFAIRAAARDSIRQSILENLLDDRHDLTGNSVYGLKFDTTVIPGRFTTGRAFVRLSIKPDQAALVPDAPSSDDKSFPDLPYHLRTYYQFSYSQIANDPANPNYNSFKLYSQWLENVRWRLNSHFTQIAETKCRCLNKGVTDGKCSAPSPEWRQEILSTVSKILAIDGAKIKAGQDPVMGIILPAPWSNFLAISVTLQPANDCSNLPAFTVIPVVDTILARPKGEEDSEYKRVDKIDDAESAYVYVPKSEDVDWLLYWPHYRNIQSIAKYVKSINKQQTYCPDEAKRETCYGYITIPSGYFNFIEKVIKPDMYAYSLFPRLEATSVLNAQTRSLAYSARKGEGGPAFGIDSAGSTNEASLMPTAIGFTDAESEKSIDLGWVVDVGRSGAPFQRSQFALVSVPAWASRLQVSVETGWLDSASEEKATTTKSYSVPIPPDYEAFDSFIGGQEAVRRPQINNELMDDNITLVACRHAAILIPGLRLWRSAMVTVGSERADRITVLPNMRGIVAEFTKLNRAAAVGDATLRVWTSEGVDSLPGKVTVDPPADPNECDDKPASPATVSSNAPASTTAVTAQGQ